MMNTSKTIRIITILFTLIFTNILYSQNSISTISSSNSCHGLCTVIDPSGGYYVGGSKGDSAFIAKMSASNNVIWSKNLTTNYGNQVRSTVTTFKLHGDTLVGVGESENSTPSNTDGGFIFKMNATNGSLYWLKGESTSNMYLSYITIYQNNYIISGGVNNGSANTNINYLCVNAINGAIVWQTNQFDLAFASTNYHHIDDVLAATEVKDGYFYAAGRLYLNGGNEMRAFVQKISATGQLIWSKYLLFPENSGQVVRFYGRDIEFIDNTTLVVGVAGNPNSVSTDWRMGLIKIDTSGTVLWAKQYNHPSSSEDLRYVDVLENGFRVVGQTNQYSSTGQSLVVFETNLSGDLTTSKEISKSGYNCIIMHPNYNNLPGETSCEGNQTVTPFSIRNTSGSPVKNQLVILKVSDLAQFSSSCFTVSSPTLTPTTLTPFAGNLTKIESPWNTNFNLTANTVNSTFTSNCLPENHQITINPISCQNYSLSSNTSAPYQILWSTGASTSQINVSQSGDYWVQIFNPTTCCYYYDTVTINIVPTETITIQLPDTVSLCNGPGLSYTISPIVTYSGSQSLQYLWSDNSSNLALPINTGGWYFLNISDGCNTASDSIFINVIQQPTITGDTNYNICPNASILVVNQLSNETSTIWSTGATSPNLLVNTAGNYYQAVENSCGVDTLFFDVEVIPNPQGFLPSDFDTCTTLNNIQIDFTETVPGDLVWSTGETTPSITISNSGLYIINSSNSCTNFIDSIFVNIIHPPTIIGDTIYQYCVKQSVTVIGIIQNAETIMWSTGDTTTAVNINQPGNYFQSVSNVCGSDTLFFEVIELPIPTGVITQDIDTCILFDPQIPLSFIQSNSSTLLWSTGETTPSIIVTQGGTYFVEATNVCATVPFLVNVNIVSEPPSFSLPPPGVYCVEQNTQFLVMPTLNISSPESFDYLWSTGESLPNIYINQSGTYTLTMSNLCGSQSDSTEITFEDIPLASFIAFPSTGCSPLNVTIVNNSANATTYHWSLGMLDSTMTSTGEFSYTFFDTVTIQLIAQNSICTDTSSIIISVQTCGCTDPNAANYNPDANFEDGSCEYLDLGVVVPNVFSPQNDEINDLFHLITVNASYIEFTIFNRWGNEMYKTSGISPTWDGKTADGKNANDGVYFIMYFVKGFINGEGNVPEVSGHAYFHLVR